jgi:hypothetical protein
MDALTQTGKLLSGVVVDGVTHRAFTLRLPTVKDNIDAVDLVGGTNGVALSAAILASQLVQLGTLDKKKQINFDLVAGMHPADFNLLEGAATSLEKKRVAAAKSLQTGAESGLPSSPLG